MDLVVWVGFLLACCAGAVSRFLIDHWIRNRTGTSFPLGTMAVNVSGCLVLGLVAGLGIRHGLDSSTGLILGSGFCGSYTTFSTFAFETVQLVEEGAILQAVINVTASLVVGTAAAFAGLVVGRL